MILVEKRKYVNYIINYIIIVLPYLPIENIYVLMRH